MFFLFGTTERQLERGVVADRCPECRAFRWLTVTEHRSVWHAYFIPLGRGRRVAPSVQCRRCGTRFQVDDADYAEILPATARDELSLDAALARTRPDIAERLAAIDALAKLPTDPAYRLADDETGRAHLKGAVATLRELEAAGVDSGEWVTRFSRWPRLEPSERDILLAELRGFARASQI